MHISDSRAQLLDRGLILSDKSSYESKIVKIVIELIKYGSKFKTINNLIEIPIFATSDNHQLIQIADACAYCTMKYYYSSPLFEHYWYAICNKMRKAPNGDATGYG